MRPDRRSLEFGCCSFGCEKRSAEALKGYGAINDRLSPSFGLLRDHFPLQ